MPFGEEAAADEKIAPPPPPPPPEDDPSSRGATAREVGGAPGLNCDGKVSNPEFSLETGPRDAQEKKEGGGRDSPRGEPSFRPTPRSMSGSMFA